MDPSEQAESETGRATRCGYVAVVGAPNAGKSTLVNQLVGAKVSIVSPKVQTTRMRVLGIRVVEDSQLIFVDTPGLFAPRRRLERAMVSAAVKGAADADVVAVLVDCARRDSQRLGEEVERVVASVDKARQRLVLVVNKIDLVPRDRLLPLIDALTAGGAFSDTFLLSSRTGDGVEDLLQALVGWMPPGPWLYPEDQLSDLTERLLAAELTREKLFLALREELPYAIAVETKGWEHFHDGSVRIDQTIYVQRESQRAIVLGAKGRQIKAIGEAVRAELGRMLDTRVHLFLYVKVRENWTEDRERYDSLGLDYDA